MQVAVDVAEEATLWRTTATALKATAGSDEQIDRKGTGTNLATMRGWSSYALRSGFSNEQNYRGFTHEQKPTEASPMNRNLQKKRAKRFYPPVNGDDEPLSVEEGT